MRFLSWGPCRDPSLATNETISLMGLSELTSHGFMCSDKGKKSLFLGKLAYVWIGSHMNYQQACTKTIQAPPSCDKSPILIAWVNRKFSWTIKSLKCSTLSMDLNVNHFYISKDVYDILLQNRLMVTSLTSFVGTVSQTRGVLNV